MNTFRFPFIVASSVIFCHAISAFLSMSPATCTSHPPIIASFPIFVPDAKRTIPHAILTSPHTVFMRVMSPPVTRRSPSTGARTMTVPPAMNASFLTVSSISTVPHAMKALSPMEPPILSFPPAMNASPNIGDRVSTTPHAIYALSLMGVFICNAPLSDMRVVPALTGKDIPIKMRNAIHEMYFIRENEEINRISIADFS